MSFLFPVSCFSYHTCYFPHSFPYSFLCSCATQAIHLSSLAYIENCKCLMIVRVWPCTLSSTHFQSTLKPWCILCHVAYWTLQTMWHCPAPCIHTPTHAASLFVYLFIFVISITCHLFCLFSLSDCFLYWQAAGWHYCKSDHINCIRRGLGRRLRSSLLLNSSPSTSRDISLSCLVETCQSPTAYLCSDNDMITNPPVIVS